MKKRKKTKFIHQTTKLIDLSVIIVSLNTRELTVQAIRTALNALKGIKGEIIVVDNVSIDGTQEAVKTFRSKVKLIENLRNLGFGAANNRGAEFASGKYFLFLNSDTIVEKNCFREIIAFFNRHPLIGIASPIITNDDQSHSLQKGSFDKFSTPFRILSRLTRSFPQLNKKKKFTQVDWVTGAALAIRKDLFQALNGFDENIFLYFEDEDLCRRAYLLDYDVAVIHNAQIIHLSGKSTIKKARLKFYDKSQNYFILKHYGLIWAGIIHFIRQPYRLIRSFYSH